jgi:hypothetical protein
MSHAGSSRRWSLHCFATLRELKALDGLGDLTDQWETTRMPKSWRMFLGIPEGEVGPLSRVSHGRGQPTVRETNTLLPELRGLYRWIPD